MGLGSGVIKLTICVPIYNEENRIKDVVEALLNIQLPIRHEVILVDDGSTDQTLNLLNEMSDSLSAKSIQIISHRTNMGKGAAIRSGISLASGDYFLIFDADAEYLVNDIGKLIEQVLSGRAKIIMGVRMRGYYSNFPSITYAMANRVMTTSVNLLFGSWLSDVHSCLKLVPTALLQEFELKDSGFGLDIEIVTKILRGKHRIYEVPISYLGRSKQEGKKIRFIDVFIFYRILLLARFRHVPRKKQSA